MQEIGSAGQAQRQRQGSDVRRVRSVSEWRQPTPKQLLAVVEESGETVRSAVQVQRTGSSRTPNPVHSRKISAVELERKSESPRQEFARTPSSQRPDSLGTPDNLYSLEMLAPQQLSPVAGSRYNTLSNVLVQYVIVQSYDITRTSIVDMRHYTNYEYLLF